MARGRRPNLSSSPPAASPPPASQPLSQAAEPAGAPAEFLNRELSWLEFNRRVLHEAADDRTPLLERLRFLGIFTSNLDEFFMKRVGGLKRQLAAGIVTRTNDGMTPLEQLAAIRQVVEPMLAEQARIYRQLLPALREQGIDLLRWEDLAPRQIAAAQEYFKSNVFAVLTPLAVDPGHPFPFISNLSTSLAILLRHPRREGRLFARVKVPEVLPHWVRLEDAGGRAQFVSMIDLIRNNLGDLFPEMVVLDVMPFRLTRNADIEREEEDAEDLLEMIEQEVRQRRFEKVVRMEHGSGPNAWMLAYLSRELGLEPSDVYELPGELDYGDLAPVADLNMPALRFEPWVSTIPASLADSQVDIFHVIRNGDVLVHHPYESFVASVERFVAAATVDPHVLAIKMTLYRTGDDTPFVPMLIRAAEANKQVVCLVELKARFDEERNIYWAQALENAGVHVVYGVVGYKTHTKTTLVVRQEGPHLRCYAHIGTGNYNTQTSKLYTDLSLLTCRPELTEDLVELFHYLTGRSLKRDYCKLLIAPVNMKERFLELIRREVEHAAAGRPAHIVAKMNSLEDVAVCRELYRAGQAGVEIDLLVRGFCCLRPGVAGLSDRIRVISVIGRFLEHSRIFHFRNGQDDPQAGEFYIGSADWMYRNLQSRVEAVAPVENRLLRGRLWRILEIMLADRRQAWDMHADGSYTQRRPGPGESGPEAVGTHQTLMDLSRNRQG